MTCPKCGTQSIDGSTFCIKCGANMNEISNVSINTVQQNSMQVHDVSQQNATLSQTNIQQPTQLAQQTAQTSQVVQQPTTLASKEQNKGKKKTPLIIILLIICLCIGAFFYFKGDDKLSSNEINSLSIIYDPDKPIIIQKDGLYGFIDSSGNVIIEPSFLSAYSFDGDYAIVKVKNTDSNSSYNYYYQVIDKSGNFLLNSGSSSIPEYYSDYGVWIIDEHLYDSDLQAVLDDNVKVDYFDSGFMCFNDFKNNQSGIINYEGEEIFSWDGNSYKFYVSKNVSDIDSDDLYATISSYDDSGKTVIVSLDSGDVLFELSNNDKNIIESDSDGIFYYHQKYYYDEKTFLYFHDGKLEYKATDTLYDMELYDYKNQILELDYGYDYEDLGKSSRYYYYDVKNETLLSDKPDLSTDSSSDSDDMFDNYGFNTFLSSYKYGIYAGKKIVLPAIYDDIDLLDVSLFKYIKHEKKQQLVLLTEDDKTILMNMKNKRVVTTFDSIYVYDIEGSTFLKETIYSDDSYYPTGYLIYNLLTDATLNVDANDHLEIYSNYVTIKNDGKREYYNVDLEKIYEE